MLTSYNAIIQSNGGRFDKSTLFLEKEIHFVILIVDPSNKTYEESLYRSSFTEEINLVSLYGKPTKIACHQRESVE